MAPTPAFTPLDIEPDIALLPNRLSIPFPAILPNASPPLTPNPLASPVIDPDNAALPIFPPHFS